MGIHFVMGAVVMKRHMLHLMLRMAPVLWPLNIYLPLAREVPEMCGAAVTMTSLLMFRLRRIVAARVPRYRRAIGRLREEIGGSAALDDGSLRGLFSVAV